METTGSKGIFEGLLLREDLLMASRAATPASRNLQKARSEIHDFLKTVGKSGEIGTIVSAEKALLQNDLDRHANSPAMKTSLEGALKELRAAETSLHLVEDPALYRAVDESHGHPKSRIGPLPKDAVRQFFKSHAARLLNQDKSRLEEDEKKIVDARKDNMRSAERIYSALQRRALGLSETKSKDRDQNRGIDL